MAYATVDQLAATLRIRVTPENTVALQSKLDAASDDADQFMDRTDPLPTPAPAGVVEFTINRAVELWKAADAAFGVIGFADTGVLPVSKEPLRNTVLLMPYKQNWAVA